MNRRSALVVVAQAALEGRSHDVVQGLRAVAIRPTVAEMGPRHLQVEIITRCNLACVMCPRTMALARSQGPEQSAVWRRHMPFERFVALLDQFPRLESLSLHGIGEPLMHPDLFEMVTTASGRGVEVRFTTNATLLGRQQSQRLLSSRLARLIVSLDGATAATYEAIRPGAQLERVLENLVVLTGLRREARSDRPRIDVNMVVQARNAAEAPDVVDLVRQIGADGLILSPMLPPTTELTDQVCSEADWQRAVEQTRAQACALGLPLFVRGGRPSGRPVGPKPTHRCMHPWFSTTVTLDGDVMPCCNIHQSEFSMGNTFQEPFAAVWNGSLYQDFRRELRQKGHVPEPCSGCPDF